MTVCGTLQFAGVKVSDSLEQACLSLAESPERYPLVPQLGPNIRRMVHKSYLVFYRVGGR